MFGAVDRVANIPLTWQLAAGLFSGSAVLAALHMGAPKLAIRLRTIPLSEKGTLEVVLKSKAEETKYVRASEVHGGLVETDRERGDWCAVLGFGTSAPVHKMESAYASLRYIDMNGKEQLAIKRALWIGEPFNSVDLTMQGTQYLVLAIMRNGQWHAVEDKRFSVDKRRNPELISLPASRVNVEVLVATNYGDRAFTFGMELGLSTIDISALKVARRGY